MPSAGPANPSRQVHRRPAATAPMHLSRGVPQPSAARPSATSELTPPTSVPRPVTRSPARVAAARRPPPQTLPAPTNDEPAAPTGLADATRAQRSSTAIWPLRPKPVAAEGAAMLRTAGRVTGPAGGGPAPASPSRPARCRRGRRYPRAAPCQLSATSARRAAAPPAASASSRRRVHGGSSGGRHPDAAHLQRTPAAAIVRCQPAIRRRCVAPNTPASARRFWRVRACSPCSRTDRASRTSRPVARVYVLRRRSAVGR